MKPTFVDCVHHAQLRGEVKYYFADFVRYPFITDKTFALFFAQKTLDFGPKNRLRIWGVPPSPPLRIFFFGEKGVTDLGGTPPPLFTDKIRNVVFDLAPLVQLNNDLDVQWRGSIW